MPREATTEASSASCSSSTSPTNMWDYHQSHAPFPSWTPYASTLLAGSTFGADPSPSDTRLPSEHGHDHAWNHGALSNSSGYRDNFFLDLLASKNVRPELFDDVHAGHYVAPAPVSRCESSDVWAAAHACRSPLYLANSGVPQGMNMVSSMPCYDHEVKGGSNNQQQEFGASMASFLQQIGSTTSVGFQSNLDLSGIGIDKICPDGRAMEAPFRSFPDYGSFSEYRSATESMTAKPYMRCADLSDSNRQEQEILSARTISGGNGAASEREKRPSEERLQESTIKKSKQEASKTSPPKQQVPKVKLGEKITALQQIVSPFGKTDTASVLFETIKYIKFLHEQVQLLSEPYTNSSRNKGNIPWGDVEANKGEVEHDLRGKGLCLVPVSWTPEIYRDNNAMDYWTPAYRGCPYR